MFLLGLFENTLAWWTCAWDCQEGMWGVELKISSEDFFFFFPLTVVNWHSLLGTLVDLLDWQHLWQPCFLWGGGECKQVFVYTPCLVTLLWSLLEWITGCPQVLPAVTHCFLRHHQSIIICHPFPIWLPPPPPFVCLIFSVKNFAYSNPKSLTMNAEPARNKS